jgi:4-aminobutyrate aminotransferase-like enzyme
MLRTTVDPQTIACLIVEPLQGEGDSFHLKSTYGITKICNDNE